MAQREVWRRLLTRYHKKKLNFLNFMSHDRILLTIEVKTRTLSRSWSSQVSSVFVSTCVFRIGRQEPAPRDAGKTLQATACSGLLGSGQAGGADRDVIPSKHSYPLTQVFASLFSQMKEYKTGEMKDLVNSPAWNSFFDIPLYFADSTVSQCLSCFTPRQSCRSNCCACPNSSS